MPTSYRWVKWTTWEYLPWWLANLPVYGFYAWFAARARHAFFFTSVNPAIPLGGAMGESKYDILRRLPEEVRPPTVLIPAGTPWPEVLERLERGGLGFPCVAKPDVGERGFLVEMIGGPDALRRHLQRFPADFIVQEFLSLPLEFSVLFHRFPGSGRFAITSVCGKEFLHVCGDGVSSVRALMAARPRAAFQLERFERDYPDLLDRVPGEGVRVDLEPIGNHCRGTRFINANHLIDDGLTAAFQPLCDRLDGILYGRFDLKCASEEALGRGEVRVMELNGVLGEPAHVYDPDYGMWRAYRDLYRHWRILYRLHRAQAREGVSPTGWREAWGLVRNYFRYKKRLENGPPY
jgi:hypothetical protein